MSCIIILVTWILDISLHRLSHSMLAWSLYTFMSYLHITDTHAYNVSHLLSYDSLCPLHRLLFHVIVSMLYDRFLLMIRIFLLLDMWAVDMRYVGSPHLLFPFPVYCSCYLVHVYCSRFPLYCSTLSTELRSRYHVHRIMYSSCSWYIVYLI